MPVKVSCQSCGKGIVAPDRARGKAVRCPQCQSVVRVPGAAREKVTAPPMRDDENFLAGLDLRAAEHRSERVCPKCAAPVTPEDIDCPKCGVNLETGVLSLRERKIRTRRGPDPNLYYSKAWIEPWKFVMGNWALVFRTALYWTVCIYNVVIGSLLVYYALTRWFRPFLAFVAADSAFVSFFAIPGWYWYLFTRVIKDTELKKTKFNDVKFENTLGMALGIKSIIWTSFLMAPLLVFLICYIVIIPTVSGYFLPNDVVTFFTSTFGIIMSVVIWVLPLLMFPVAIVHMSQRYTYKAWLLFDMVRMTAKNILPVLYWWVVTTVNHLPAIGWFMGFAALTVIYSLVLMAWVNTIVKYVYKEFGFFFVMLTYGGLFGLVWLLVFLALVPLAISATATTRLSGLFAYFFGNRLELENQKDPNVIATFGPRFISRMADWIIIGWMYLIGIPPFGGLTSVITILTFILTLAAAFMFMPGDTSEILFEGRPGQGWGEMGKAAFFTAGLFVIFPCVLFTGLHLLTHYWYYKWSETGIGQGTLGKWSVGLVVTDMEGKPISKRTARNRYLARWLTFPITLGLGWLLVLFTPKKQALHDLLTNTLVVWKGDDERPDPDL